jgi:hypothetical protein
VHPCCRAADRAEGKLICNKAAEEAAELQQKEAAWRAKMQAMNEATAAANATLQAFRAAEQEQERLMDAAIEGKARLGGFGVWARVHVILPQMREDLLGARHCDWLRTRPVAEASAVIERLEVTLRHPLCYCT